MRQIQNETELKAMARALEHGEGTLAELMDMRNAIIEYNDQHYPRATTTGPQTLRGLLAASHMFPGDVAREFGSLESVEGFLRGQVRLSAEVAEKLGNRFCMKPAVFLR